MCTVKRTSRPHSATKCLPVRTRGADAEIQRMPCRPIYPLLKIRRTATEEFARGAIPNIEKRSDRSVGRARGSNLRGGGVRFLRAQRSTCTENLLHRLIIIKQISDRNRQHIRSVSPSLAVLISAKDVPELWAGGAGISRAGQAGCCSRTCWNYGLVVLEFRARVRPNVARGHAGIMGWWCSNFPLRLGTLPTAASAYCLPTLVLLSEPSVAQSSPASVIAVGACLWGTRPLLIGAARDAALLVLSIARSLTGLRRHATTSLCPCAYLFR